MPSSNPEIRAVAETLFDELISDLILSTLIQAHREIKRSRTPCGTCGTLCRSHNLLQPLSSSSSSSASTLQIARPPTSRTASPQPSGAGPSSQSSVAGERERTGGYTVGPERGTGGSTGVGSGSGRMDGSGNVFFDCLVCGRAVVSNRYAPHLSSCLGLSGSTRRGASRTATAKARLNGQDRSTPSLYVQGDDSDQESNGSKKGRKSVLNGNGKRKGSPSPVGMVKKKALSTHGTPVPGKPPLPPSRLGRPPIANSSPASSPEKSIASLPSQSSHGGVTSRKRLPGMGTGVPQVVGTGMGMQEVEMDDYVPPVGEVVDGESSEGADDDY